MAGRWILALGLAVVVGLVAAPSAAAFTDVSIGHAYAEAIEDLATRGVIGGYPDGTFRPDNPVYRWQFAKMIVGALDIPIDESKTSPFGDLDPDTQSIDMTEYVAVAYENGITTGKSGMEFAPYDSISRAQVVTMVVRAMESLHPGALKPAPAGWWVSSGWTGFSAIHEGNARVADYNGLFDGIDVYDAASNPWAPMPRGEVAQMLYNLKDFLPFPELVFRWGEAGTLQGLRVNVSAPQENPGGDYAQPAAGKRFVEVQVTLENVGQAPRDYNSYDFSMRAGNTQDDSMNWGNRAVNDIVTYGTLSPGQQVSAWRVFEIPAGASVERVTYNPSFSDIANLVWQ